MRSGTCFVTTTSVLAETANALSDPLFKPAVVAFHRKLQASSRVEIVFVDPTLWSEGWALFEQRPDKGWSLTDCISISLMQDRKIDSVLTSDRHFEQAGFRTLLS